MINIPNYIIPLVGRLGNICRELYCAYANNGYKKMHNYYIDLDYYDTDINHLTHQYVIKDNLEFLWWFRENCSIISQPYCNVDNRKYYLNILHCKDNYKNVAKLFYKKELFNKYKINNRESVAIHIRRTDYLIWKNGKFLQKDDDILKIIDNNEYIYIYSDDMNYCVSKFSKSNVEFIHNDLEYKDIIMMSQSTKVYYSYRSTFGWLASQISNYIRSSDL